MTTPNEYVDALKKALQMADVAYAINYEEDAAIRRVEEKLDAVIRYLIATAEKVAA